MDLAIVENGIVVNRILGPDGFGGGIKCAPQVSIGWAYDGSAFIPPARPEPLPPPPAASSEMDILRADLDTLKARLVAKKVVTAEEIRPGAKLSYVRAGR